VDWLCLPDYDGTITLGALLEPEHGGFFRLGPAPLILGRQRYLDRGMVLATTWSTAEWELELVDFMEGPQDERGDNPEERSLVRRLRCVRGPARCRLDFRACYEFDRAAAATRDGHHVVFDLDAFETTLWASAPLAGEGPSAEAEFELKAGEACCAVFHYGRTKRRWSQRRVEDALRQTLGYWESWGNRLTYDGPRAEQVRRSASVIHLMGYAPAGSSVASPTTSLPERIGGDRNYDYRFAWIRDASLSAGTLSMLGDTETASRYMDWLAQLGSCNDAPLQVAYGVNGETDISERERFDVAGYRGSLPVRQGNHVYRECQLGGLGYLADCAFLYLEHGGQWQPEYWYLIRRIADYTAARWREQDHGIWELHTMTHHVSSKVMSWVTLDRALAIARRLDDGAGAEDWCRARDAIHQEVLVRGWSQRLQSFRQSYGADTVDASALLIPLMGFLPPNDPRVLATLDRVEEQLMANGFVYRFDPGATEGVKPLPLGEFEGAFLPSTFMLASGRALCGPRGRAEELLDRAEAAAGELGLFAEEIDARSGAFLGNTPLLFSHAEYVRAVLTLAAGT
jgi:GH15 family glucan-1,4-alpha-glucosidase